MLPPEMRLIEIPRKMPSLGVFNEHFFQKFCTKWGKRGKTPPTLGTFFTESKWNEKNSRHKFVELDEIRRFMSGIALIVCTRREKCS